MKRGLALVLCLAMLLSMVGVQAEEVGCAHENQESAELWYYCAFEAVDAENHKVFGEKIRVTTCSDCAQTVDEVSLGMAEETAAHDFYEGKCVDCEYVCLHEKTVTETEEFGDVDAYVTSIDDTYHQWSSILCTTVFCDTCGIVISENWGKGSLLGETERHHYVLGECGDCLHLNPCTHPNGTYMETGSDDYYEEYDAATHIRYHYEGGEEYCVDCRDQLDLFGEETEMYEAHTFEDGYCTLCGAENTCEHMVTVTNTYFDEETVVYEPYNNAVHSALADQVEETVCSDCGETIATARQEKVFWEYLGHGDEEPCWQCGYVSTCAHNGETSTVTQIVNSTFAVVDEDGHNRTGDKYEYLMCEECGEAIQSSLLASGVTEYEQHYFMEDSCCKQCGYELTAEPTAEPTATPAPTAEPTAEPTATPAPTAEPTAEPTATPAPTAEPTAEPTAKPTAERNEMNATAWVTGDFVNVRAYAGTAYEKIGLVCSGDELKITASVKDSTGTTWYEFKYAAGIGYIHGKYVTFESSTIEPTAEPTAEPTIAPVVNQAVVEQMVTEQKPMVETMISVLDEIESAAEADGVPTVVEIAHMEKVVTEEEKAILDTLPVKEQMIVMLAAIGHKEAVDAVLSNPENELIISEEAQAMIDAVTERLAEMTEEDRAAFELMLLENFPVEEIELEDGTKQKFFVIELIITREEQSHVEYYGFRYDEENESWIFTELKIAEAADEQAEA